MNNKQYILDFVEKFEKRIPELSAQYEKCMPRYTPNHDGFKNNLIMKLQRSAENIKKYCNGEAYDFGVWYFDALDLVNALTLIKLISDKEELGDLLNKFCEVLCVEYDEARMREH